jgi:para-nitrobenzyl esterase
VVQTSSGRVRGRIRGDVAAFLGVPYAEPPTGERRLRLPEPCSAAPGVLDAAAFGPAAPQPPSRLGAVLDPMGLPGQDENCLNLNVWTTARPGAVPVRPVLVWLHGGGYLAGAGSQPWFDGTRLAREHGLVVITLNYRLGALGFLYLPGGEGEEPVANLGIHDQLSALRWVRDNVAAFGGDPGQVTLAGQSAGGQSVLAILHRHDPADPLYRRAVIQSAPLGLRPLVPAEALDRTGLVLEELGIADGGYARLRDVPTASLIAAQSAVERRLARPFQLGPAFQLVADGFLPGQLLTPRASSIEVTFTATENEADAFTVPDPRVQAMERPDIESALRALLDDPASAYAEHAHRHPALAPPQIASDLVTRHFFHQDMRLLAAHLRARGCRVRTHRFTWHPGNSPLRAAHCIELPFEFGNVDSWRDSPLLRGASEDALAEQTGAVQRQLALW